MFRKTLLSAATVAAMMSVVPAFADVAVDSGSQQILITGKVIDAPCSIATSTPISVDLGQVSDKLLKAGTASDAKKFTITLTGCSFSAPPESIPVGHTGNNSKVAVEFTGAMPPVTGEGTANLGYMGNAANGPDAATNVSIQLLKSDGMTGVDLAKGDFTMDDAVGPLVNGENNLDFFVRMASPHKDATPGAVAATLTYKLHYF
ncbi:long polar fimbrial protein LpfA [Salmonella enterica subsp. enterica serovar Muenchen]|nr:long polar fimbrial protein LpfA [Salmonella enterica subsp. enterica serovar Muenchen]EBW7189896.1 long polar fimbrial protein LpfA [Salmonella enterica subsp. enterica serovar Muenchen]EBX4462954.1 long polar fimbrial protein LpfA [Salmonella enterica subsp. enterica serovar Muenchen]EBY3557977.1 long polar fimbrial protein LpfA [Salmonella enterica subsp. enterica serovar Muenchen]